MLLEALYLRQCDLRAAATAIGVDPKARRSAETWTRGTLGVSETSVSFADIACSSAGTVQR